MDISSSSVFPMRSTSVSMRCTSAATALRSLLVAEAASSVPPAELLTSPLTVFVERRNPPAVPPGGSGRPRVCTSRSSCTRSVSVAFRGARRGVEGAASATIASIGKGGASDRKTQNLRAGRNSAGRPVGAQQRATLKLYSGKPREGRRTGAAYHWHDGISESTAHALAGLGKFFNPPSTARLDVLRGLVHTAKGSMMALPVLCSISFTFSPAGRARAF